MSQGGLVGDTFSGRDLTFFIEARLRMTRDQMRAKGLVLANAIMLRDRAAVIIQHDDDVQVIYDDKGLFPSDQLVTQLRLILKD
jgi:hypothetical protein